MPLNTNRHIQSAELPQHANQPTPPKAHLHPFKLYCTKPPSNSVAYWLWRWLLWLYVSLPFSVMEPWEVAFTCEPILYASYLPFLTTNFFLFSHPPSMYLLGHGNSHHVWDRRVLNEGHLWVMVPREILFIRLIGHQELFFVVIVRLSLHSCISYCLSPSQLQLYTNSSRNSMYARAEDKSNIVNSFHESS